MAPRSPKRRKNQRDHHHPAEDDDDDEPLVCLDALAFVMDFLAPRDLYRLAFTCKGLTNPVSIPQVVKSALFQGGRPQKTIQDLVPSLLKNEQIHPVSPLRLLRLVNARRCECCNVTGVREDSISRYRVAFCHRRCLEPCEDTFGELPLYPVDDVSNHDNDVCVDFPYWTRVQCVWIFRIGRVFSVFIELMMSLRLLAGMKKVALNGMTGRNVVLFLQFKQLNWLFMDPHGGEVIGGITEKEN